MNDYEFKYFNGEDESKLYDYKILDSPDIWYTESLYGIVAEINCTFLIN
jgi:hypothetical protein